MSSPIFEMNLSMEATSLYLLLEGLAGPGAVLLRDECLISWNASEEEFEKGQEELLSKGIVEKKGEGLKMVPTEQWKRD